MADSPYQVLLITESSTDAAAVGDMLQRSDEVAFRVESVDSLLAGLDRLAQGKVDVILLDLFLPDSRGLETFATMHTHAPDVPILVWSSLDSQPLAISAVQAGAQDYLIKDRLNATALARTIHFAIMRQRSRADQSPAEKPSVSANVIGLIGGKGGVGTTTIACHLAVELQAQSQQPILLMDLDWDGGLAGFLMSAKTQYTMLDAARNVQRLDQACWAAMVARSVSDVDVLPAPGPANLDERPRPERIRHVLRFARSQYSWIVVDLGRLNALSASLVPEMKELLVIAELEVPALFEAKRVVEKLLSAGAEREHLHLVLNRTAKRSDLSAGELEQIVGLPVYATVPNNYEALYEAYADGGLLPAAHPVRRRIAAIAARLAGIDEKKAAPGTPNLLRFLLGTGK